MKKIKIKNLITKEEFELTTDEYKKLRNNFDKLSIFKLNSWSFRMVQENHSCIMKTSNEIFKNLSIKFPNTWLDLEEASFETNKLFLNYLSSVNTFVDHQRKFLSEKFGKKSDEFKNFKIKTNEYFDKHFSYRLLYQLRNYTVHCGFSILKISSSLEESQLGKGKVTYIPKLNRKEILEKFDFGKVLKPQLEKMVEDIEIYKLIYESIEIYKKLNEYIESCIKTERTEIIQNILSALKMESNKTEIEIRIIDNNSSKISQIPYHYLN